MFHEQRRLAASFDFLTLIKRTESLKIVVRELQELEKIRNYAEARLKQGLGKHADMLQIQIDLEVTKSRINSMQRDLDNQKDAMRFRIGDTSGETDFQTDWSFTNFIVQESPSSEKPKGTPENFAAESITLRTQTELASLDTQRSLLRPSFSLGVSAMQKPENMWMNGFMVGVTIPIFSLTSQSSLNQQMALTARKKQNELHTSTSAQQTALAVSSRRVAQAKENHETLQKRILPLAEEHLKFVSTEFVAGKLAIADLINAERSLLNLRISEIEAHEQLEIERLTRHALVNGLTTDINSTKIPQLSLSLGTGSSGMNSMSSSKTSNMKNPAVNAPGSKKKNTTNDSRENDDTTEPTSGPRGSGGMKM